MNPFLAELIGTTILVLFGNGVVANVVLNRTKGNSGGWIVITAGWAFGVFTGVFCSQSVSGAHLNPAVTLALALAGSFPWKDVATYLAAQMLGGFLGGTLVFLFYREHFRISSDADGKLACFCTAPNIRHLPQSFFCEMVGTFFLILPVFLMTSPSIKLSPVLVGGNSGEVTIGLGTIGALPVALLVFALGLSLGGTTGYAINPARDLGPRLAHALLPIPGKRDGDWAYSWVPVLGPFTGAVLATLLYLWIK